MLLAIVSLSVLTVQAQNRRWEDIQQRFALHTNQLEQEARDVISVQTRDAPVDLRVAAWYTHWYSWSWGDVWQSDWQAQKENLDPRVHIVDWEALHSAVLTRNIKTIYYWQPERTWFDISVGCFYALDGEDIYVLFEGVGEA